VSAETARNAAESLTPPQGAQADQTDEILGSKTTQSAKKKLRNPPAAED
jgi:hypothetical protein